MAILKGYQRVCLTCWGPLWQPDQFRLTVRIKRRIWCWLLTTFVCTRNWSSHRHPSPQTWRPQSCTQESTRNGNYPELNFEAFVEAMRSPNTGLTYTALAGKRKQSVIDAERLLSYHVANFVREKGYEKEYQYVTVVTQWHEACDGRGISQLKKSRYNYEMLNYILNDWIPIYWIPTWQSCKTVICSFSFLTGDFPCLNKVFTFTFKAGSH